MKSYPLLLLLCCLFGAASGRGAIKIIAPAAYIPGTPVLVWVEVTGASGKIRRDLWDAVAALEANPTGSLSTNQILLRNGVGSRLLGLSGGIVDLQVTVNGESASKSLAELDIAEAAVGSGALTSNTTWSGIIRVTNDVIVPAGITLTIEPGTVVLFEGISSTTNGVDLEVRGQVLANGTEEQPITFTARQTAANWNLNWGQIRHLTAAPSTYRYVQFSKAGRTRGEGHTGTGPMIRGNNSTITFEHCSFSDNTSATTTIGKVMMATGCELVLNHCLLTRSRMGPEINGTSLLCTNTYILDMSGPDDSDGIYLHNQQAGQQMLLTGCVVAYGEDDGIDTLGSTVTITNSIVRNYANPEEDSKGISIFSGRVNVLKSLVTDCLVGISAKGFNNTAMAVTIDRSTIVARDQAFGVTNKSNVLPAVNVTITNTILRAATPVFTDYSPDDIKISYSALSAEWPGEGNTTADPLFVDAAAHDYRLQSTSPLINAGDPLSPLDPDGTRADIGAFPFLTLAPPELSASFLPDGRFQLRLQAPTGPFTVQSSIDLIDWENVGEINNSAEWTESRALLDHRFYRLVSAP